MILRRIGGALRRQDWTAVVVELLIVVVGIVIGLQVTNWDQARQREATADATRQRMVDNLERDIAEFDERTEYYRSLVVRGATVLRVMNDPTQLEAVGAWRFLEASFRFGQIWPFGQSGQVYRELLNKGDLDLVGGPEVRVALADYYDSWDREFGITVVRREPFRERVRQLMPMPLQNYLTVACISGDVESFSKLSDGNRVLIPEPCAPPDTGDLVEATAQRFAGSEELLELARGAAAQANVTLNVLKMIRNDARVLIEMIEGED